MTVTVQLPCQVHALQRTIFQTHPQHQAWKKIVATRPLNTASKSSLKPAIFQAADLNRPMKRCAFRALHRLCARPHCIMETPVHLDALHTALIDSVTAPDIVALLLHYHKFLRIVPGTSLLYSICLIVLYIRVVETLLLLACSPVDTWLSCILQLCSIPLFQRCATTFCLLPKTCCLR